MSLVSLFRDELREQTAYHPKAGSYAVRLDANEAPPFWSEGAKRRFAEVAAEAALERYPDTRHAALKAAVGRRFGGAPEELSLGCGSDELIANLLLAVARGSGRSASSVVSLSPTFVMYRVSARIRGLHVVEVPLDAGWNVSMQSLERAIEYAHPAVVFVATPNNPTGTTVSEDTAAAIAETARESLVVFDEAYGMYAEQDLSRVRDGFANVLTMGTLSKIGLAGARVGFLRGRPELVAEIEKARQPYNLPSPSQAVARVALDERWDEIVATCAEVVRERERLALVLGAMGCTVTPSQANFLWVRTRRPASEVFEGLSARGVLVRSFHDRGGRLANQLRVTVGTKAENDAFLDALAAVEP